MSEGKRIIEETCPKCGGELWVFPKQYTRADLRKEVVTPSFKVEICHNCNYFLKKKLRKNYE